VRCDYAGHKCYSYLDMATTQHTGATAYGLTSLVSMDVLMKSVQLHMTMCSEDRQAGKTWVRCDYAGHKCYGCLDMATTQHTGATAYGLTCLVSMDVLMKSVQLHMTMCAGKAAKT
jgi:hypothetical protein